MTVAIGTVGIGWLRLDLNEVWTVGGVGQYRRWAVGIDKNGHPWCGRPNTWCRWRRLQPIEGVGGQGAGSDEPGRTFYWGAIGWTAEPTHWTASARKGPPILKNEVCCGRHLGEGASAWSTVVDRIRFR